MIRCASEDLMMTDVIAKCWHLMGFVSLRVTIIQLIEPKSTGNEANGKAPFTIRHFVCAILHRMSRYNITQRLLNNNSGKFRSICSVVQ